MEIDDLLNVYRGRVLQSFEEMPYCFVQFKSDFFYYRLKCEEIEYYSYIRFPKKDPTSPVIFIRTPYFRYYAQIKIPTGRLANRCLLDAMTAKIPHDYLSLVRNLVTYDIIHERIIGIICEMDLNRYRIIVDPDKVVISRHVIASTPYKWVDVERYYVILEKKDKKLRWKYVRRDDIFKEPDITRTDYVVKDAIISLKEFPKIYESLIKYIADIKACYMSRDLVDIIKDLVKLVKVEKRDIEDAIRELAVKYGPLDIFDYLFGWF